MPTKKKRPINKLVIDSYNWWGKSFVFIKKEKIKIWYVIFAGAFITGMIVALSWSVSTDVHQSSQAAKNLSAYSTCNDTDGGKDFFKKGKILFSPTLSDGTNEQEDFCGREIMGEIENYNYCSGESCKLHEYFCQNNQREEMEKTCPGFCVGGACIKNNELSVVEAGGGLEENKIFIQWYTNLESQCNIIYSPNSDLSVSTSTMGAITGWPSDESKAYTYSADIENLEGGTTYYYKIMCSKGKLSAETEINSHTTVCSSVTIDDSTYRLEPCNITEEMFDYEGNKDFSFNIIQEGEKEVYGFAIYGYGNGFPTYAILGGSSSGGAIGNTKINKYFSDKVLSSDGPENGLYKGYLPVKVKHGNGSYQELRLNIDLKVKPPERILINERSKMINKGYVNIEWETNINSTCMLAYSPNSDLSNGTSMLGIKTQLSGSNSPYIHSTDIYGLEGDAIYYYKIMCNQGEMIVSETEISSFNNVDTDCSILLLEDSKYYLEPCSIIEEMIDGQGNKDFSFNIVQEGEKRFYGFSVYGYGVGFPTYAILGGSSSGGAIGNLYLNKYFNDNVLSIDGPENGSYKGYLPIWINHGSSSSNNRYELRLSIDLKVKPEAPQVSCVDSDGGINYNTKGTLQEFGSYTDFCENNLNVREYYCSDKDIYSSGILIHADSVLYTCPNGCQDGACIGGPVGSCIEPDSEFCIKQISSDLADPYGLAISDNYIAWIDQRDNQRDVFIYDIEANEERQITNDTTTQNSPSVDGNYLVWEERDDVFLYNILNDTIQQIHNDGYSTRQGGPSISGNYIVWTDNRNGNSDIYLYDIPTQTERRISTSTSDQESSGVSGDYIVYRDYSQSMVYPDVYLYDISTQTEYQITNRDGYDKINLNVSGNYITWSDNRGDISLYNFSTKIEEVIAGDNTLYRSPFVSGNNIVWVKWYGNYDVQIYDIIQGTTQTIFSNLGMQYTPHISGNNVAWLAKLNPEDSGEKFKVLLYNQ